MNDAVVADVVHVIMEGDVSVCVPGIVQIAYEPEDNVAEGQILAHAMVPHDSQESYVFYYSERLTPMTWHTKEECSR